MIIANCTHNMHFSHHFPASLQLLYILFSLLQLCDQVHTLGQQGIMGYWRAPCNWMEVSLFQSRAENVFMTFRDFVHELLSVGNTCSLLRIYTLLLFQPVITADPANLSPGYACQLRNIIAAYYYRQTSFHKWNQFMKLKTSDIFLPPSRCSNVQLTCVNRHKRSCTPG